MQSINSRPVSAARFPPSLSSTALGCTTTPSAAVFSSILPPFCSNRLRTCSLWRQDRVSPSHSCCQATNLLACWPPASTVCLCIRPCSRLHCLLRRTGYISVLPCLHLQTAADGIACLVNQPVWTNTQIEHIFRPHILPSMKASPHRIELAADALLCLICLKYPLQHLQGMLIFKHASVLPEAVIHDSRGSMRHADIAGKMI